MADWPYNTDAWQRLRKAKLARDPLCEYCPGGAVTPATQVDHRKAIRQGGDPWAWQNLASACELCHSRKTYHVDRCGKERVPVKGCDPATGLPLDPAHWWTKPAGAEKSLAAENAGPMMPAQTELVPGSNRGPEGTRR